RCALRVVLKHGVTPLGRPRGRDSWEKVSKPGLQRSAHPPQLPRAGPLIARGKLLASPGQQTHTGRERRTAHGIREAADANWQTEPRGYAKDLRGQRWGASDLGRAAREHDARRIIVSEPRSCKV